MTTFFLSFLVIFSVGCTTNEVTEFEDNRETEFSIIQKVAVSGTEDNYTFSVTIKSPDLGCSQYANWWEVINEKEELVYRRILGHSHVSEQPFTRSGGSVHISSTEVVIIRGHMNTTGYGEGKIAMKGSISAGFLPFDMSKEFGSSVERIDPQPNGCAF